MFIQGFSRVSCVVRFSMFPLCFADFSPNFSNVSSYLRRAGEHRTPIDCLEFSQCCYCFPRVSK